MVDLLEQLRTVRCRGRSCGAPIVFVATWNGHTIPLNATPDPAGNVTLDEDLLGSPVATVHAVPPGGPGPNSRLPEPRFMPHHATCPDVEEFRDAR